MQDVRRVLVGVRPAVFRFPFSVFRIEPPWWWATLDRALIPRPLNTENGEPKTENALPEKNLMPDFYADHKELLDRAVVATGEADLLERLPGASEGVRFRCGP